MRVRLAAVVLLAVLAAGCGSAGGSSTGDAAGLVPTDALAYVSIDTDLGSGQLSSAQSILDKFPIKDKLLAQLKASLAKNGPDLNALESSIGPELDLAILKVNGATAAVGFTQPADEKAFDAELDRSSPPLLHETIDGWTVFSDKQANLDAVTKRTGQLADDAAYQAAVKTVPAAGDAIARAYVSPAGAQTAFGAASSGLGSAGGSLGSLTGSMKWATAALTAQDGAFKLEVHAKTQGGAAAASGSGLADEIPSGSLVALSITDGTGTLPANVRQQLSGLSQQLGIDLPALVGALDGPVIAYVRPGLPLPDVTIAAKPSDPQSAVQAVAQLIAKFVKTATPVPTKVDGGTLNKVDLGPLAVYYGVADGRLVVTDSANALAELNGAQGHLSDDAVFKEAKDGAGMPDAEQGFLYVNMKDARPALEGVAQLANKTLPASVDDNLKPLRSLLAFGSRDGDLQTFVAYLKTS